MGSGKFERGRAFVVLFDPETVGAGALRRVNDLPGGADRLVSDASAIEMVMVNGTIIRWQGKDAIDPRGSMPGHVLRGGSAAPAR